MTPSAGPSAAVQVLMEIPWSLIVAVIAAAISWRAYSIAARSLSISERNEKRRQPALTVYLAQAHQTNLASHVVFMFAVSIGNPTDIDNAVARIELCLAHMAGDTNQTRVVMRFDHDPTVLAAEPTIDLGPPTILQLPLRIDAHQTGAGWMLFSVPNGLLNEVSLESYTIVIEDTHGQSTVIEPIIIQQWISDVAT
jgi:hypothetical protein